MMRGGNRNVRRMMDKMGVDLAEIPNVLEVTIKTNEKEIIITKPVVNEMKSKEGSTFTITAEDFEERELETPVFPEEDVRLVCNQARVSEETAKEALKDADGDLARAIMMLTT